jgi:hypothetical protein
VEQRRQARGEAQRAEHEAAERELPPACPPKAVVGVRRRHAADQRGQVRIESGDRRDGQRIRSRTLQRRVRGEKHRHNRRGDQEGEDDSPHLGVDCVAHATGVAAPHGAPCR